MTKSELRKIYLARQKSISVSERSEKSARIAGRFFAAFDLREIKFLHCFLPIEKFKEIDTRIIFQRIRREFPTVETLAPRVDFARGEIESLKLAPETELARNAWQIDEPARGETVAAEKIDLILVPLLCFDARGFRVGYGRGFYDKFLKNCRDDCLKIGLSYFAPIAEIFDAGDFDVRLDFCVTPTEILHSFR